LYTGDEADLYFVPGFLTVSMSRSRVFLGGLVSTSARLRFPGCHSECTTAITPVEHFATADRNDLHARNLPGLLAKTKMAKRSNPALSKPVIGNKPLRL
jgi:hypothetical protein